MPFLCFMFIILVLGSSKVGIHITMDIYLGRYYDIYPLFLSKTSWSLIFHTFDANSYCLWHIWYFNQNKRKWFFSTVVVCIILRIRTFILANYLQFSLPPIPSQSLPFAKRKFHSLHLKLNSYVEYTTKYHVRQQFLKISTEW